MIRLGVNLDHIATVRNARGENYPDPIRGGMIAAQAGADNITLHLREDRRHIRDDDLRRYRQDIVLPLNMEMAATYEMKQIALEVRPHSITLVPEKREERTTEGGLDVIAQKSSLADFIKRLRACDAKISLFVEPNIRQIDAARAVGADAVEIHTGHYASCSGNAQVRQALTIAKAANHAVTAGLGCHAGHGLTYHNVQAIAAIDNISELNIGHFLISEAIFVSLESAIKKMRRLIGSARKPTA